MAPWFALLEAWAVQALLRTPAFHRAVEKVAKNVHRVRHGLPREEEGGTRIEGQDEGRDGFTRHFMGAVKGQLGAAEEAEAEKERPRSYYDQLRTGRTKGGKVEEEEISDGTDAEAAWRRASKKLEAKGKDTQKVNVTAEDADAAWRSTSRQGEGRSGGFMSQYMDALREQVRENKRDGQ